MVVILNRDSSPLAPHLHCHFVNLIKRRPTESVQILEALLTYSITFYDINNHAPLSVTRTPLWCPVKTSFNAITTSHSLAQTSLATHSLSRKYRVHSIPSFSSVLHRLTVPVVRASLLIDLCTIVADFCHDDLTMEFRCSPPRFTGNDKSESTFPARSQPASPAATADSRGL